MTRGKLLGAFDVALDAADEPFLPARLQDRAKSVVGTAVMLLGRIPGTTAFETRMEAAAGGLSVKTKGLLRRRLVLEIATPDKMEEYDRWRWLVERFSGLNRLWLANRLEMPMADLAAAVQDRHLRVLWLLESLRANELALAGVLAEGLNADVAQHGAQSDPELLRLVRPEAGRRAMTLLGGVRHANTMNDAHQTLTPLYLLVRQPLTNDDSRYLLQSRKLNDHLRSPDASDDGEQVLLDLTAILASASRASWIEKLAPLPLATTMPSTALARLLDGIDRADAPDLPISPSA